MNVKTKVAIVVVYSVSVFAFGRYLAPTKEITKTKIVEVEKKKDDTVIDKKKKSKKKIVIVENSSPDGKKEKVTTITDDTTTTDNSKESSSSDTRKSSDIVKEITRDTSSLTISILTGLQINSGSGSPIVYGGYISKRVLGPFTLGIWGLTNTTAGFSLGLIL